MKKYIRWGLAVIGVLFVVFFVRLFFVLQHNPLPKDEELLRNFTIHRSEFEQLLKGFRNYRAKDHFYHHSSSDVKNLMRKASVSKISEAGEFGVWYPEPYSEHTLQVRKSLTGRPIDKLATQEEILTTLRRELPAIFDDVVPVQPGQNLFRVTEGTIFFPGPEPTGISWGKTTLRYPGSFINKGYCYFPQPPRVEEGHLIVARYDPKIRKYTARPGHRVFTSLDKFPPKWRDGEYVLKRIDDHWFLFMCRVSP
jgi:hypothetical protein